MGSDLQTASQNEPLSAPAGGLYVPQHIPNISTATMKKWRSLSYTELAVQVISTFVGTGPPPYDVGMM